MIEGPCPDPRHCRCRFGKTATMVDRVIWLVVAVLYALKRFSA